MIAHYKAQNPMAVSMAITTVKSFRIVRIVRIVTVGRSVKRCQSSPKHATNSCTPDEVSSGNLQTSQELNYIGSQRHKGLNMQCAYYSLSNDTADMNLNYIGIRVGFYVYFV